MDDDRSANRLSCSFTPCNVNKPDIKSLEDMVAPKIPIYTTAALKPSILVQITQYFDRPGRSLIYLEIYRPYHDHREAISMYVVTYQ